jgi:hypothetical protein
VAQELCKQQSKANQDTLDSEFLSTLVLTCMIKQRAYLLNKVDKVDKAEGAGMWYKDLKDALPKKVKITY